MTVPEDVMPVLGSLAEISLPIRLLYIESCIAGFEASEFPEELAMLESKDELLPKNEDDEDPRADELLSPLDESPEKRESRLADWSWAI